MPSGYPPSVFISSTCYDLSQIRLDLKNSIELLGYVPVFSESPAFPVNPQADNLENCLRAVRDRADLFVLVVGGRYGSQVNGGNSITNLEYLEARAKGVPIFVFVAQSVLHNLSIWKANPEANFSSVVDSPKLFEFVHKLRGSEGHWVFSFNDANEIIETLRIQWALLFTNALQDRERLQTSNFTQELLNLPASCLRVLLTKPLGWEHRFFGLVLKHEIGRHTTLKRDVSFGIRLGEVSSVEHVRDLTSWVSARVRELSTLVDTAKKLGNEAITKAVGPPGQSGDPDLLAYVARRLGDVYERLLTWTHKFVCISSTPEFERYLELCSLLSKEVIAALEALPDRIEATLLEAEEAIRAGKSYSAEIVLALDIPSNDERDEELKKILALNRLDRIMKEASR